MNGTQTENDLKNPAQDFTLGEKITGFWHKFCDWVWKPAVPSENIGLRILREILRIIFIVVRESQDDRITLRASALTFTIVLSLVPMLALGTAVLKGLGAGNQMRQAAYGFIEQFEPEVPGTALIPGATTMQNDQEIQAAPSVPDGAGKKEGDQITSAGVTSHLRLAVDKIFDYVDRTDFTTLGTFGVIGMVLAALSVLGSIEQSMNAVWQTTTGRALGRKVIDYMALMILLPVSINLALAATATLQSPALHSQIQNFLPVLWLEKFFFKALPVGMLVITFTLLYQFLPNTRVGFLPALAGGIFGGLTWYWVQILYVKLQIGVAKYNAIYGSFATLPLFLMWIYVAWVVFLFGAEVAFAFQARRNYDWGTYSLTPAARLAIAFDIMESALENYDSRKTSDRKSLALSLNQTEKTIGVIINELVDGGLLCRVEGKLEGYVPAGPLDELKPSEIMDIILGKDLPDVKGCDLAGKALEAARGSLDRYNLNCREVNTNCSEKEEPHHGTT